MASLSLTTRTLRTVGAVARHVPLDQARLVSFLASPAVRADPWSLYQRLHQRSPVYDVRLQGIWLVASHAEVTEVLRHPVVSVDESLASGLGDGDHSRSFWGLMNRALRASGLGDVDRSKPFSVLMERTLLFTDPPDHARLRRLVARAFTPRTVDALRPRIDAIVDQLLGELAPHGRADLVAELALPFPVAVICELFGVPEADRTRLTQWGRLLAPALDVDLFRNKSVKRDGDQAALELENYLGALIDDPSRRTPDGLISALVAVSEDGDRLSRDEVIALCGLLLVAGFETTTNLIANGILELLANPEQLARLRDGDADPLPAVEELLRMAGPVQFTQRVPLEDLDVAGNRIPARSHVALLIGAANRDPLVFDDPDRLDLTRDPNPHLAFSSGIHHCVGAALARLEAQIAIPAILRQLPELRLDGRPQWRDSFVLRGLTSLPVRWTASWRLAKSVHRSSSAAGCC